MDITSRRIALVTGAGRRLGQAIAMELARAGYDLIVHYLTSEIGATQLVESVGVFGVRAFPIRADLANPSEIEQMFETIRRVCGKLHILVNSAAVFQRIPPESLDIEAFEQHIAVNLRAPYLCCINAARSMNDGGNIINITDISAENPMPNYIPYCVSKAGLIMLTLAMAKALAPRIKVNAVSPGFVLFPGDENPEKSPTNITTAEEVAIKVRELCESDVTGTIVRVPPNYGAMP